LTLLLKWRAERIDSRSRHNKHSPTHSVYIIVVSYLQVVHMTFLLHWRKLPSFGAFHLAILLVKIEKVALIDAQPNTVSNCMFTVIRQIVNIRSMVSNIYIFRIVTFSSFVI